MATYSEIWNELERLRTKWRSMTDEEKSSSDSLAMEERAKGLKERLVAMESAVEIKSNEIPYTGKFYKNKSV